MKQRKSRASGQWLMKSHMGLGFKGNAYREQRPHVGWQRALNPSLRSSGVNHAQIAAKCALRTSLKAEGSQRLGLKPKHSRNNLQRIGIHSHWPPCGQLHWEIRSLCFQTLGERRIENRCVLFFQWTWHPDGLLSAYSFLIRAGTSSYPPVIQISGKSAFNSWLQGTEWIVLLLSRKTNGVHVLL